jgi:Xaa-Pro aminopeptidase
MNPKILQLRSRLKKNGLDGIIVTKQVNVSYLTNSFLTDSCLLITKKENFLITDFRYMTEAQRLKDMTVHKREHPMVDELAALIRSLRLRRVGFESRAISYNFYIQIHKKLKQASLVATHDIVEEIRLIKNPQELRIIRQALRISKRTYARVKRILKPGRSEKVIAREIDIFIRAQGGDGVAFSTIVASGSNAAKPHAVAGTRVLRRHEPIIVDLGVRLSGYSSDLTRTFSLGKMNPTFHTIYTIVRNAQDRAIAHIKPGRLISEIDRTARDVIARAGYGEQFGHALGHGVGREIHESPSICKTAERRLRPNMVFTVEPAIYIPRWGGIRIEDMVRVTQEGCEVLSRDIDKSI